MLKKNGEFPQVFRQPGEGLAGGLFCRRHGPEGNMRLPVGWRVIGDVSGGGVAADGQVAASPNKAGEKRSLWAIYPEAKPSWMRRQWQRWGPMVVAPMLTALGYGVKLMKASRLAHLQPC